MRAGLVMCPPPSLRREGEKRWQACRVALWIVAAAVFSRMPESIWWRGGLPHQKSNNPPPSREDNDGETPLYCAIRNGHKEVIKIINDARVKESPQVKRLRS